MGLSTKLFVGTEQLFVRYVGFVGRKRHGLFLAAAGILLIAAFIPGFAVLEEESQIDELYVHKRSRLPGEYDFFKEHFGGLPRVQATIHQADNKQTATRATLDAILDAITPMYKEDESDQCSFYDGVVTSRPTLCDDSAYASNIYCSCQEIAGNPDQISVPWPTSSGENVLITQKDLCESPPVPDVLKSADELAYKPTDANATESAVYQQYQNLVFTFLGGSVDDTRVFRQNRDSAVSRCNEEVIQQEAQREFEDITASVLECLAVITSEIFGPAYALDADGSLDSNGMEDLWELAVRGESNTTVLSNAYTNATTGAAPGGQAIAAWNDTREAVADAGLLVAQAVAAGFGATRAQFAAEGRVMSYGYAETAQCVAQYTFENQQAILANVGPSVMRSRDLEDNGALDWDTAGLNAAFASLEAAVNAGANISTDAAAQVTAVAVYASAAVEPFNTTITQAEQSLGATFNATGLAAARAEAEMRYAANVALNITSFTAADEAAVRTAYSNASSNGANATQAAAAVTTAVAAAFQLGQSSLSAVIEAVVTAQQAPAQLMPEMLTLNGTVRPLPRGWGIDRFPCSRTTGLDVFREGDFDLPYRMKQLDRVSRYMYYFFTLPYFQDAVQDANCLETSLLQPLKSAIYLEGLQDYPALYQQTNFPAIEAAEAAYLANINDISAAEQAARNAFVANGYQISTEDPFNPVMLTSTEGQAFLNTTEGKRLLSSVASSVATAAPTAAQVDDQFVQIIEAFFVFGFWYRPAYGTHPLASASLSDAEILGVYDSALRAAPDPSVTVAECIAGNADVDALQGEPVLSCFLTWSGLKLPYQLSLGPLEFSNETSTVSERGPTSGTLLNVQSQRTGGNNYNEDHHLFQSSIDGLLGKGTTSGERERIHRRFERAVVDHYTTLWGREPGSGVAPGEEHDGQRFHFTLERSISDTINSAGAIGPGLLVGGFLCLVAYVMFVSANCTNAVYSHAWLALGGVILIALATAAALGFSAFCGVPFTPISSNVVPFVALGIGIDDVLVILSAYSNAVLRSGEPVDVIQSAMADAGPSVSFTSFTNFVAFLIASATPVTVVQLFCYQMVISVSLNYILILIVFVPLLFLDARRVRAGKKELPAPCHQADAPVPKQAHPMLGRFFGQHFGSALMSNSGRALVLVCACVAIGLSIWQVSDVKRGVLFSSVAEGGSYQHDFTVLLESDFNMYNGYLVTDSRDFPAAQGNVLQAVDALQAVPRVSDSAPIASIFWLHSLLASESSNATQPLAEGEFYSAFSNWLAALGVTFLPDLSCMDITDNTPVSCYDIVGAFATPRTPGSNPNVRIVASRGLFYLADVEVQEDYLSAIRTTRSAVDPVSHAHDNPDDPGYRSFVFSYVHLYWEQYLHSYEDLYLIVGLCLLGIFMATFAFQFSVVTSLLLCVVIFIVGLEVYALMPAIGLTLNAFSTTNLCLAIGMAVEFTAHIAHQFLSEAGDSRRQRVRAMLRFMGTPLFNGAVSSLLAVLFIAGSRTGFIRDYYFSMFFATIVIAYLNGVVLLPVLLSLVGPAALDDRHKAAEELVEDGGGRNDSTSSQAGDKLVGSSTQVSAEGVELQPTPSFAQAVREEEADPVGRCKDDEDEIDRDTKTATV